MRACDNFSDGTDKRFVCRVVREQALPGGGGGGHGGGGGGHEGMLDGQVD